MRKWFHKAVKSAYGSVNDSITIAERKYKLPPKSMRKFDGLRGEIE